MTYYLIVFRTRSQTAVSTPYYSQYEILIDVMLYNKWLI